MVEMYSVTALRKMNNRELLAVLVHAWMVHAVEVSNKTDSVNDRVGLARLQTEVLRRMRSEPGEFWGGEDGAQVPPEPAIGTGVSACSSEGGSLDQNPDLPWWVSGP
jgi:hypothetical protein